MHQVLDPHLNRPLLKHLLGIPVCLQDLEFVDSALYQTLSWILQNDGVADLGLYFSVDVDRLGQLHCVDLLPGGAHIAVNDENKQDFVRRRYVTLFQPVECATLRHMSKFLLFTHPCTHARTFSLLTTSPSALMAACVS